MTQFCGVLYNIMPIVNIPSVIQYGILSHNEKKKKGITSLSVAMENIQEKRDHISVSGGMALHNYANLYFDARNPMMFKLKSKNLESEICVLILNENILKIKDVVLSDRNASSGYARFLELKDISVLSFSEIYSDDWRHPDCPPAYYHHKSLKCAEALVPHSIPFEYVISAEVVNEKAKKALESISFPLPISINPNRFFC